MIVPLITLIVRLIIIMFACLFAANARQSDPPPPTVVVVVGDGSGPPHQAREPPPPPGDGSHNVSSPTLPPYEVKNPNDGSHNAPPSTRQTPTLPMKVNRPGDAGYSTVYPEYQGAPSPRAPDAAYQSSFSASKPTNIPATEQGEHHGLSMV